MSLVGSKWVQMGPNGCKLVQIGPNGSKRIQIGPTCPVQVQTGLSRFKQVQMGPTWLKNCPKYSKLSRIAQNVLKWSKLVFNCTNDPKCSKMEKIELQLKKANKYKKYLFNII